MLPRKYAFGKKDAKARSDEARFSFTPLLFSCYYIVMKNNIAVLRGGPGEYYDLSLKAGSEVLSALDDANFRVFDILIDKQKNWYRFGRQVSPMSVLHNVDMAFNLVYGPWGEGGGIQQILSKSGTPFLGSGPFASAITYDKTKTKEVMRGFLNINLPKHVSLYPNEVFDPEKELKRIFKQFPPPYVIKPIKSGFSMNVAVAKDLTVALEQVESKLRGNIPILVEEFIDGTEVSVAILENTRGEELYPLLPTDIVLPESEDVYDFNLKTENKDRVEFRCPSLLSDKVKTTLTEAAKFAHEQLGLSHYSRSDFIVTKKNEIYFLETNSQPPLSPNSSFVVSAQEAGIDFNTLIKHLIELVIYGEGELS